MGRPKSINNIVEYRRSYYNEHKDKFKPPEEYCDICKKNVKRMVRHKLSQKHQLLQFKNIAQ